MASSATLLINTSRRLWIIISTSLENAPMMCTWLLHKAITRSLMPPNYSTMLAFKSINPSLDPFNGPFKLVDSTLLPLS